MHRQGRRAGAARTVEYPDAVSETVPASHLVISDEEIFAAHEGGKLSVELKAPLDTQRALSIAYTPVLRRYAGPLTPTPALPPATPGRTGW